MTKLTKRIVALVVAALAGCGGGSASFGESTDLLGHPFVIWGGNSSRDKVVDANSDVFAFYADSGCLYNFQTGRENPNFCLTSSGDTALYAGFPVRIVNVRSSAGICIAALIDEPTGHFLNIESDSFGREIIFVTALVPAFCSG